MELFTSRLDPERLARATDSRLRGADLSAFARLLPSQSITTSLDGTRQVVFAGSETPRERIWLQLDACSGETTEALFWWAALESLTTERAAKYRIPVVGRARIAVLASADVRIRRVPTHVPFLDAGALGAQPHVLAAMRRFAPSLVVHVQDWSAGVSQSAEARVVESFRISPETHAALPAAGRGQRFSRRRRAYRDAAAGPDWIIGARAMAYVRRTGARLADFTALAPDRHVVHEIGPARFVPTMAYRALGGGSLAELALASCGAHAVTLQLRGGDPLERASLGLAVAEAFIVNRMGLVQEELGE